MADADKIRPKPSPPGGKGGTVGGKGTKGGRQSPNNPDSPGNMETLDNLEVKLSGVNSNQMGVWSREFIPEGTKFGPFQGEKLMTLKKDSDPLCVWEIVEVDTKEFLFYLDASRSDQANWLRYVQCARHYEEQNLISEQEGIDIMYRAIKPIEKDEELLIWYKTPTTRRGQRQAGRMTGGKAKSMRDLPTQSSSPKRSPTTNTGSPKKKSAKSPRVGQSPLVDSVANSPQRQKPEESKEKQNEEEVKKKEKEEEVKKQKDEEVKKKQKEEDLKKQKDEEIKKKQKEEEVKKQKDEEVKKKQKEEDLKKQKNEEVKKKQKEEELKKKQKNDEVKKKQQEEEVRKKQKDDEVVKERKEEDVIKNKKEEEGKKKQKDEELKKKKREDDIKKKQKAEEEKEKEKEESLKEEEREKAKDMQKEERSKIAEEVRPDLDLDRDSSELEIDLDDGDADEEEEEEDDDEGEEVEEDDSDATDGKLDGAKSTQSNDPEKFHFKLKKHHITKSRHGRKVFRCDICSGIYRHAFSLKRHYIRNHINLKYVSRADILNCQINPESQDMETNDNGVESQGENSLTTDSKSELTAPADKARNGSGPQGQQCDKTVSDSLTSKTDDVDSKDNSRSEAGKITGSNKDNSEGESKKETGDKQKSSSDESNGEKDTAGKELCGLFRCNVCSGIFNTAALLKSHLDNHPNFPSSKAFACDQCDMKFAHKQNLRRHLAVHTGEKPFLCKFCGKTFPTATNQKRHERIHLGRRVACDYCSSTFTQSGDLKKHIRKLHPECFHECAFCGKYFTDEDELIEHVASHNESMESNEAERHRRRDAFKVDMELDRIESMKLAEQKTQGIKFACTVCKKRFLDYANMCRHRRLAHQRHLLLGQGSASSSPVPSPTKLASDSSDGDPQAFFYANVANNISENLTNYIEGTKDHINKTAHQLKWRNPVKEVTDKPREITPKVESDLKDLVAYNFPSGFCLKQNYRKAVTDKDRTSDKVKEVKAATNVIDLKVSDKSSVKESPELNISDTKCITEVRTVKLVDPNLSNLTKEDQEVKPVISTVNGVSLNIPVFNLTNLAKREVKTQPVCTVQPIQRHSQSAVAEPKLVENPTPLQPKKSLATCSDKPSVIGVNGSHQGAALAAVKLVTNQLTKPITSPPPKTSGNKTSHASSKTSPSQASCLALKIPQVHVCSVCRRLFNNEALFRQHMMDKHKTTPEESQSAQKDKEQKEKSGNKKAESSARNMEPVMDLSSKPEEKKPAEKATIDHDEGARLLLDFALGIRDEPKKPPCAAPTEPPAAIHQPPDDQLPLDLSANISGQSTSGSEGRVHSSQPLPGRRSSLEASYSTKPSPGQPAAAHGGNRAPAAHSGHNSINHQSGKVQGLLRIPTYHPAKDLDLPAPLVSPPGTPQSPWQPQLPFSLYGPFAKVAGRGNSKKYICTVCYGEFHSRGALLNHQRATHTNVRCDHVEVDNDVVAPWWQKPSPVGMLNVCSSQMSEYDQTDQKQFNCTKCKKSFRAVEDLHSHIFECASPAKVKTGGAKAKLLPTPPLVTSLPNTNSAAAEAEAAEAAAQGLRLLAAGHPRVPFQQHSSPGSPGPVPGSPLPKTTAPVSKNTAPVSKTTAPVSKTTAPVSKNTAPVSKTTAPVSKSSTPVYKPTAPVAKSTAPVSKSTPSLGSFSNSAAQPVPFRSTQSPFSTLSKPKTNPSPVPATTATTTKASAPATLPIPTPTPFSNLMPNLPTLTTTNTTTSCAADSAAMLNRFKTSILKKLKKKKKAKEAEDGLGLMGKKRRRSLELLYNPQNHVRRREMKEVVDMQRCQGCGQRFATISLLERHIPACEQKDRLKEIQIIRNPFEVVGEQTESRNMCRYCSKQFTYAGMLRKHVFEVCQVRKTRLQEAAPLDAGWEQELGQHHSGASSQVDACSNDGSHADDAVSVATSTSSSHDAESAGRASRRRKRKNRGWGNSKKKRSSSDAVDVSPEFVDDTWSPEGDAEGLTIRDEEDIEDDENEGNLVCDLEHQSVSEAEEVKGESSKAVPLITTMDSIESEDELKIDENVPEDNNISTENNHVPVSVAEPKVKTETPTCSKTPPENTDPPKEAPKVQQQQQPPPLIGRHTLPFVLSIPAFRERPPLGIKAKATPKTLPITMITTNQSLKDSKLKQEGSPKSDATSIKKKKTTVPTTGEKPVPISLKTVVKSEGPCSVGTAPTISPQQGSNDRTKIDISPKTIKTEVKTINTSSTKSPPKATLMLHSSPGKALVPSSAVSSLLTPTQAVPKADLGPKTPSIISTIQAVILSASKPLTFEGCDVDGPKKILTENKIEVKIAPAGLKGSVTTTLRTEEARIAAQNAAAVASLLREVTVKKPEKLTPSATDKLVKQTPATDKTIKLTATTDKLMKPTPASVKPTVPNVKPVKLSPAMVKPVKPTATTDSSCNNQGKVSSATVNKKITEPKKSPGPDKSKTAVKKDTVVKCTPKQNIEEQSKVVQSNTESKGNAITPVTQILTETGASTKCVENVERPKDLKSLAGEASPAKLNSSVPTTEDSEDSSDEEDIKEIINTVLAQRKQGQKQKTPKQQKKPKKVEPKSSNNPPTPTKSPGKSSKESVKSVSKANNIAGEQAEAAKASSERSPQKSKKATKAKNGQDNCGKPPKSKAKKKVSKDGEKTPEKSETMKKKSGDKNTGSETVKSDGNKAADPAASPKKVKDKKKNTAASLSDPVSQEPPTKKKKVTKKETADNGSPKKAADTAGKGKTKAKKGKLPLGQDNTETKNTKKMANLKGDSPAKVQNKTKAKAEAKKPPADAPTQETQTPNNQESTVSPAQNRKRKSEPASPKLSKSKDTTNSKNTSPSPAKLMKTRGGATVAKNNVASESTEKNTGLAANKARRTSVRGISAIKPGDKGKDIKGKGKKAVPAKLKRSVSASVKLTAEALRGRAAATSMRTRQSRLSL